MKIFNFALLGLINAQAPSPQKDCTDCLVSLCQFQVDNSSCVGLCCSRSNFKKKFLRISLMHTRILSRQIQVSLTNGVTWQKVNVLDYHLLHKACAKVWLAKPSTSIWTKSTEKTIRLGAKGYITIIFLYGSCDIYADSRSRSCPRMSSMQ